MARPRTLQRSFAGGEMSPSMHARVDDVRFQNGYASGTRNYEVHPNGRADRRRGLRRVNGAKYSNKLSRLIPFTFSVDQTMQVELGESYFRFHSFGVPLRYATPPLVIASTSAANDTITFTTRHGLASNTAVRFTASAGGTIPGGLVEGTTYYVKTSDALADAKTIQVSATAGPGATFNIDATAGVGTSRLFLDSEMPRRYFASRNFLDANVDLSDDRINLATPHGFAVGDPVQFTNTGGALPTPLVAGTTYYVIIFDANQIQVATTLANALASAQINITAAAGGGTHKVHRLYSRGDLTHWLGAGHGVFYCRADVASDVAPAADGPHWYLEPDDGIYEVPHRYPESALDEIGYDGSNDVISLTLKDRAVGTFTTTADTDIDPAGNTITETAHGLIDGVRLTVVSTGAFPAATPAIVAGTSYFVVGATTDTFQIATTLGGTAINITADATAGITLTWTYYTTGLAELRRYSTLRWLYQAISFAPDLPAPVIGTATPTFGAYQYFTSNAASPTLFTTSTNTGHGLIVGDSVYVEAYSGGAGIGAGGAFAGYPAGYYEVSHIGAPAAGVAPVDLKLKTIAEGVAVGGIGSTSVYMRLASLNTDIQHSYRVTAVGEDGLESQSSATATASGNNLTVPGAYNTITWSAVTPTPSRYNVYKKEKGVYGFIGKVDADQALTFKDENIAPDLSRTLPIFDTTLGNTAGDSPATVTHFDQRRVFAGTTNVPNGVWATRANTETDLSYHVPLQDDDRLRFEIASKEAVSIRHLVPLKRLVIMTNSTEFQVVPVNSEVLTPSTLAVRATSYQGSSIVRPAVMSGNVLFCADRGGHVFEIGENPGSGELSKPGDLCLRSEHLFDGETLLDQSPAKAPHPIDWFCSSSGLLLGLTYVPQEQIGAWHSHDTAASGFFESCCVTAEGDEDALYCVVQRTINGSTVRSIERMAEQHYDDLEDAYFVDAGGTFDGTNTDGVTTMTVSGGTSWAYGDTVTVTCSAIAFVLGSEDVGDHIAVRSSSTGTYYRVRITAVSTNKIATGTLLQALPTALRNVAVTTWAFARDTISLSWLEGQTVQVLGDGVVQAGKVVTSGVITLDTPAIVAQIGLGFPSPMRTLPVGLQVVDAWGQGREKNVNKAWLRVIESGEFRIGPTDDEDDLVPANTDATPGTVATAEVDTTLMPDWQPGAEIVVLMEDPLPLTILGVVLEISLGGG